MLNKLNLKGLALGALLGWLIVANDKMTNAYQPPLLTPQNEEGLVISYELKVNPDNRREKVRALLAKYNSPMVDQADFYVDIADKYNLDWRLLVSISGIESGFGKYLLPNSYNPFGWGGGYLYFDSWEESIETVSSTFDNKWRDWTTLKVDKMAPVYCPPNYINWTRAVTGYMEELDQIDPQNPTAGVSNIAYQGLN